MSDQPDGPGRVIVLGSTGSIGTQTLVVIEHLNSIGERRIDSGGQRRLDTLRDRRHRSRASATIGREAEPGALFI